MLGKLIKFAGGLLVGAAVGAAIGVFLAPKSGSELKDSLRTLRDDVVTAGQQAEAERRAQLMAEFTQAKQARPTAGPEDQLWQFEQK